MSNLTQRSARMTLALITGLLINLASARAEEPDPPAPNAPPNAPESPVSPSGHPAATPHLPPPMTTSSATVEPTLTTETTRSVWPNKPLLATGATVFAVAYLPAVAGGAFSDADRRKDLYIPIAGPWMMMTRGEDESRGEKTLLVIDGVAQGLGALMIVSSLFIPERSTKHWYLIGSTHTQLSPTRVGTGYGLGAHGRF